VPHEFTLENLTAPLVTIHAGPEAVSFSVHKHVLVRADFFAKCLAEGRFSEAASNTISLPEESPRNMAAILRFLYTGMVSGDDDDIGLVYHWGVYEDRCQDRKVLSAKIANLIDLYVVADRYCIQAMCDKSLTFIEEIVQHWGVGWPDLKKAKDVGMHGSPLWHLLLDGLTTKNDWVFHDIRHMLEDGLKTCPDVCVEIMETLAQQCSCKCSRDDCGDGQSNYCDRCGSFKRSRDGW
jgi:hypothetical protein